MSEKASIGDVRKVLRDFLAPELREVKAQLQALTDGQKSLHDGQRDTIATMREGFQAQTGARQQMEARLLREIRNAEEKLLIRIQLAEANIKLDEKTRLAGSALRENEQLRREKAQ